MAKYSVELYKKIETIQEYYKQNKNFWIFQKIIKIFIDTVELMDEKYIVLPKVYLNNHLIDVNDVWKKHENNSENNNKLNEIKESFLEDFDEIKTKKKISENDKINTALN